MNKSLLLPNLSCSDITIQDRVDNVRIIEKEIRNQPNNFLFKNDHFIESYRVFLMIYFNINIEIDSEIETEFYKWHYNINNSSTLSKSIIDAYLYDPIHHNKQAPFRDNLDDLIDIIHYHNTHVPVMNTRLESEYFNKIKNIPCKYVKATNYLEIINTNYLLSLARSYSRMRDDIPVIHQIINKLKYKNTVPMCIKSLIIDHPLMINGNISNRSIDDRIEYVHILESLKDECPLDQVSYLYDSIDIEESRIELLYMHLNDINIMRPTKTNHVIYSHDFDDIISRFMEYKIDEYFHKNIMEMINFHNILSVDKINIFDIETLISIFSVYSDTVLFNFIKSQFRCEIINEIIS